MGRMVLVFVAAAVVTLVQAPSATGAGGWTWPVRGEVITAYSNDNARPYAGGMHRGIDIAGGVGTRVVAARPGRVTFAGPLGSSGITVAVATADGRYVTSYLHLSRVAVARGQSVGTGREIGAVGTTGKRSAEQPHLHFGVRRAGAARLYVDPTTLLPPIPAQRPAAATPVRAPARVRPQLQPVPAGLLQPRKHAARPPVPALTPEPSPFPVLGWGPPVCLGGLLLLAAVLSRRLARVDTPEVLGVSAPVGGEGLYEVGVQNGVHLASFGEGG
jgi:peptidase M23-like protein